MEKQELQDVRNLSHHLHSHLKPAFISVITEPGPSPPRSHLQSLTPLPCALRSCCNNYLQPLLGETTHPTTHHLRKTGLRFNGQPKPKPGMTVKPSHNVSPWPKSRQREKARGLALEGLEESSALLPWICSASLLRPQSSGAQWNMSDYFGNTASKVMAGNCTSRWRWHPESRLVWHRVPKPLVWILHRR